MFFTLSDLHRLIGQLAACSHLFERRVRLIKNAAARSGRIQDSIDSNSAAENPAFITSYAVWADRVGVFS